MEPRIALSSHQGGPQRRRMRFKVRGLKEPCERHDVLLPTLKTLAPARCRHHASDRAEFYCFSRPQDLADPLPHRQRESSSITLQGRKTLPTPCLIDRESRVLLLLKAARPCLHLACTLPAPCLIDRESQVL